jgi:hypothetical protein
MQRNLRFFSCWVCRRHGASHENIMQTNCGCRREKQMPLFSPPCSTVESPGAWISIFRISTFKITHFHIIVVTFRDCLWRIRMKPRDSQICLPTFLLFGSQLSAQSSWPTLECGKSQQTQVLHFSACNRHRPYQTRSGMLGVMTRRSVTS